MNYKSKNPCVSIGMPVYNGEFVIRQALNALLEQTFKNIEIIISDNASNDATEKICREYEARDSRIKYIRQNSNIGAAKNFKFVLEQATGTYFMWAACDDIHSIDFISINIEFLEENIDYVASLSPVRFEGGSFNKNKMGDSSLAKTFPERILEMFGLTGGWFHQFCSISGGLHANGRFYSLIRRHALIQCDVLDESFLGSDWAVVLHLASVGKIHRARDGFLILGRNGTSASRNIFRIYRKNLLDAIFPFHKLSKYTWRLAKEFCYLDRFVLAVALAAINMKGFIFQFTVLLRKK